MDRVRVAAERVIVWFLFPLLSVSVHIQFDDPSGTFYIESCFCFVIYRTDLASIIEKKTNCQRLERPKHNLLNELIIIDLARVRKNKY